MKNPSVTNIDATQNLEIAKLRANYGNLHKGYFEKEADELRAKILSTGNTEEYYKIKGTKYYVSVDGDDKNDGKTPETAIKTLDRIDELKLTEGDAILFKRGDTFRFARTIEVKNNVTYGSYGEGPKPQLFASPENYALNDSWQEVKPNIWQIPFDYNHASGCVLDYGMTIGIQKYKGLETFEENGDYHHDLDNKTFYLYCDLGKPNEVYHSIEIMPTINLMLMHSNENIVVDNLCFKYSSGFGITAADMKGNVTVTNCEFGFLGGLWTNAQNKTLRFGNAVEFWCGGKDIKISNNWFYQTYDSALTWQGNRDEYTYENIHYTGNLFEYNNADIEFFDGKNVLLKNFVIKDNIMRFTSMGWGSRPNDGAYRGIEGCIRGVTGGGSRVMNVESAYFTDNIIDCPARQIINWNINPDQRNTIHTSGTKLYVKSDYRTLEPCLQGLQTDLETQPYDRKFAVGKDELIEMFSLFEDGAEIHWEK